MKAIRSTLLAAAALALALLAASCALPAVTTQRRALVIGISDYINLPTATNHDLSYPAKDAGDMKTALETNGWVVDSLLDHAATKSAIRDKILSFFSGLPSDGTALIYYSGHGTELNNTSYIVPSDFNDSPSIFGPLISSEELSSWIVGSIDTKNVIFIADSCNSGEFARAGDSSDQIATPYNPTSDPTIWVAPLPTIAKFAELLSLNAKATGDLDMITISAAGLLESSYETSALQNGVFTHFLLEAATKGDQNRDGFVSCTEAYSYAAKRVDSYWNGSEPTSNAFYPHISGGWRDLVLF
jgi:uncharacterized caspase-like protein